MKRLKRAQPMVTRLCARREQRSARQLLVEYKKKVFSMISNANVIYILIKKCTIFNILRVSTFLAFCVFFLHCPSLRPYNFTVHAPRKPSKMNRCRMFTI